MNFLIMNLSKRNKKCAYFIARNSLKNRTIYNHLLVTHFINLFPKGYEKNIKPMINLKIQLKNLLKCNFAFFESSILYIENDMTLYNF